MYRLELSEMLMKDLVEGSPNEKVISCIKDIIIKIEKYLLLIDDNSFIGKDFNYNDLAETIRDISKKEYYYAITRLDDYLLRGKSYQKPLSFYELYIIYSFLNGIILSNLVTD